MKLPFPTSVGEHATCGRKCDRQQGESTMDKRLIASVAAVAGVIVGFAGANVFLHAPAASSSACPAYDAKADANIDAEVKQLHAHDHDQYVPQPAKSPFGDSPKAAASEPIKAPAQ
jgi:hypothetical protein